jgi:hypothetical protein
LSLITYGYHEARMRVIPSAQDIERMEECIEWLRLVENSEGRIIWLRAERVRWRQICIRMGCVRSTAWRRWAAALITIANRLNQHEKSLRNTSTTKSTPAQRVAKTAPDGAGTRN